MTLHIITAIINTLILKTYLHHRSP